MNCSLCGLPQDTGALGSVLPQCICHWKHTPYQGTRQTELNAGGEPVKNATYWKRQHNALLMKLNTSALKIAQLEKLLEQSIGSDCREMRYIQEIENKDARIAELEKELAFMEGEYPEPTIASKIKEFASLEQAYNKIAELEKDLALKTRDRDVFRDFTLAYEKRIEELEKLEQDFIRVIKQTNPNKPQTKPLSDEEQDACFNRGYKEGFRDSLLKTKPLSGVEIIGMSGQFDFNYDVGIIDFARAIEAKVRGQS